MLRVQYFEDASQPQETYLFLVDMTLGGMRVNLESELKLESLVTFQLPLSRFAANLPSILEVRCRVCWSRCLLGGTWVYGLEFQDLDQEVESAILRLLDHFDEHGGRRTFRLEYPMAVEAVVEERPVSLSLRDLSSTGLGFRFRGGVSVGQHLTVMLPLGWCHLETDALVVWAREAEPGVCDFGCSFADLDEDEAKEVRSFILTQCQKV